VIFIYAIHEVARKYVMERHCTAYWTMKLWKLWKTSL